MRQDPKRGHAEIDKVTVMTTMTMMMVITNIMMMMMIIIIIAICDVMMVNMNVTTATDQHRGPALMMVGVEVGVVAGAVAVVTVVVVVRVATSVCDGMPPNYSLHFKHAWAQRVYLAFSRSASHASLCTCCTIRFCLTPQYFT